MKEQFEELIGKQDYLEECRNVLHYIQQIFDCTDDNKFLIEKLNDLYTESQKNEV